MLKKIGAFIVLSLCFVSSPAFSKEVIEQISCDSSLQQCLTLIQKLPAAREMLTTIQKEGAIRILSRQAHLAQQFGAFWDPDQRTIVISASNEASKGKVIRSIIFECHNALKTKQMNTLARQAMAGKISKADYVRGIEWLEYQNSLSASKLVNEGIEKGLFPESAYLPVYDSFEEHYAVQQQYGHSQWIGNTYDHLRQGLIQF